MGFQSTHSLRSATPRIPNNKTNKVVSIHALLAECDNASMIIFFWMSSFNPRTPCGVRPRFVLVPYAKSSFQSTHSLRSATRPLHTPKVPRKFQSTHSLRSATRMFPGTGPIKSFQSTHSLRSATGRHLTAMSYNGVSIHALLAECDTGLTAANGGGTGFNPRTPCGVRPSNQPTNHKHIMFQSTHSLRSATDTREPWWRRKPVSIHALLAECDPHQ